jgi:transposase-like protein
MNKKTSYGRIKLLPLGGFAMSGKKGMKEYPPSFKEQAVHMHIEDGLTIREINERLGIADRQRLKKWCAAYRKEGLLGLQPQRKGRPKKISKTEAEQLSDEVKRLRMENELLRNFLYEVGKR